ncbi:MAG: amidohydrolase [Clostridiales bacterium]|nr:amidohydrolase [Clostridiales bacterium]
MLGNTAFKSVDKWADKLREAALAIWENPELGFHEEIACKVTADLMREAGFAVEVGIAGIPTAIKATYGSGHPVIGFLGEFDALPGLSQVHAPEKQAAIEGGAGHGCGHNLLGIATAGACIAAKEEMEERGLAGTLVFYGCPAEEIVVGKGYMAKGGAFDGIDLSVSYHPGDNNSVSIGTMTGVDQVKFAFYGRTAHAAGAPEQGRSALDAVELMNIGANYLREHVPMDVRMHYIITEGGKAPNIVPDYAENFYFVRAFTREGISEVYDRLVKIAQGAALMTETELEVKYIGGCYPTLNNRVLADIMHEALTEAPQPVWTEEDIAYAKKINEARPELREAAIRRMGLAADAEIYTGVAPLTVENGYGSTDVGDVQHIAPGIFFSTATQALGASGHSWQVTACSGSEIGIKGMLYASRAMALFALKICDKPETAKLAKEEFDRVTGGKAYICPVRDVPLPL